MAFTLTSADERKLVGVNARLVTVVRRVALHSSTRFMVVEGLRTKERQARLLFERKTKTLNSRHLTGDAVDIAPLVKGVVSWQWKDFDELVACAKESAQLLGIRMVFGYDWGWDAPHWELKQ